MRVTVTLDSDVAAEVERLRRQDGLGPSEAINRLVRQAIALESEPPAYQPRSEPIGLTIDVTCIGDVLDVLDDVR